MSADGDSESPDGLLHLPPPWTPAVSINDRWLADEGLCVEALLQRCPVDAAARLRIGASARALVETVRAQRGAYGGLDAFLQEYDLSTEEGVVLMCLAEALLRIPDAETADRLIADRLGAGHWEEHLGSAESVFVNASTWGLMLSGRLTGWPTRPGGTARRVLRGLVTRVGEPVLRTAMRHAMRILGHQFVMGRTVDEALQRAARKSPPLLCSFDMLGEAAVTDADAERYFSAYAAAVRAVGAAGDGRGEVHRGDGVSVKLSALHPRFEYAQRERTLPVLHERLLELARLAADCSVALTVDAEEADRLELTLTVFERIARDPALRGWGGLGIAVQAYQKRAPAVIDWLCRLARDTGEPLSVRLVKGAYWDTEIKRAQLAGLAGYPVYTRKVNTDVAYLACAHALLEAPPQVYPQFATHNAHTVASVLELAGGREYEFQRLHGMGRPLYDAVAGRDDAPPCRVYAPVGQHRELLPYLVRRLLENGANTSFVNRIVDRDAPVDALVADPLERAAALQSAAHPRIPLPVNLYRPARRNSAGLNLSDRDTLQRLSRDMHRPVSPARPLIDGQASDGEVAASVNPATGQPVGDVHLADRDAAARAVTGAEAAWADWGARPAPERAERLERAAELFERHRPELMALCVSEGGKTVADALAEVREAVDFLRYYAAEARRLFARPQPLPGPTGERNELWLRGRGVFVCISPWNFPLAIFTGQVAGVLAAGNTAVAKPAEQTPLVAARAVALMHEAGIPPQALQFLPGRGEEAGAAAVADARIAGVLFTGSTEVAATISRSLAAREGERPVLVAETGGQNAMLVDSSALPEQVVLDAVSSAFHSAGQRCSALRVLYLQREIADTVVRMLKGHMAQLRVGDPRDIGTDVGPVIDADAREALESHLTRIGPAGRVLARCEEPRHPGGGFWFAPALVEIDSISQLREEVFGPVLHVVRYDAGRLDEAIDEINGTGYGLTLGIHSRIESTARHVAARARVGNVYINRNQVGAVVGVQPFGGRGLSGTGPKAGGPHYLPRLATETTVTENTAALGGNASLLVLGDEDGDEDEDGEGDGKGTGAGGTPGRRRNGRRGERGDDP